MFVHLKRPARMIKLPLTAVVTLLALGLTGCGASQSSSPTGQNDEVKLSLDWSTYVPYHAPFIVAEEEGIFAKHGISVTESLAAGSKDAVLAVGTNQADIAWADLSTAASSMLADLPIKAVATVQEQNASGITVLEKTKFDSAQDVVGLRIGSTPGGSDSTLIGAFLKKNGIAKDQVEIVNLPSNGKFAALMTGKVDAISGQVYYYVSNAALEGKTAHGKSYSEMETDTLDHGFVASDDFISDNPEAIGKFLSAYREALEATKADPASACKTLSEHSDGAVSAESCETQLDLWLPLTTPTNDTDWGLNDSEKWESTVDVLKTHGDAEGSVPASEMFTNELLPSTK